MSEEATFGYPPMAVCVGGGGGGGGGGGVSILISKLARNEKPLFNNPILIKFAVQI